MAVSIGWWNVQNLFSTDENKIAINFGYSKSKGWTKSIYKEKIFNLANAIKSFTEKGVPDLLGLCEIENSSVLTDLIEAIGDNKYDYICHEATDMEAIDTAFIYNRSKFELVGKPKGYDIYTRHHTHDILEITLKCKKTKENIVVLANHWPSRRSGRILSEPFRIAVADYCSIIVANHLKLSETEFKEIEKFTDLEKKINNNLHTNLIIMGDFNDEPFDRSVREYLMAVPNIDIVKKPYKPKNSISWRKYQRHQPFLYNPTWKLLDTKNAGTYYHYSNVTKWAFLDQIIMSKGLLGQNKLQFKEGSLRTINHKNVATKSGRARPFTFNKNKSRGTSDHLPMVCKYSG
ncbi:MAG: hypothetical protein GY710_13015 [Desulfobacteraceae bacterium]|nr:hypothetical protein [Desulfobacteraceae bacterium]